MGSRRYLYQQCAFVLATVVLIIVGVSSPTTNVQALLRRVKVDVVKTRIRAESTAAGCPDLTNPGGRIAWNPSADAGPWPTTGDVIMPTQGIKAPIVRVGVDTAGSMVVPHNARDIAWLDEGPLPGRTNNIVLAGHIDYNGIIGSFNGLQKLQPGDTVAVEMDGKVWAFEIKWGCLFDRNTTLASRIMGYTNTPSITLISCGGVWDPSAGTHDKRVAVRGELIKQV